MSSGDAAVFWIVVALLTAAVVWLLIRGMA
jgi:hypothetical protein